VYRRRPVYQRGGLRASVRHADDRIQKASEVAPGTDSYGHKTILYRHYTATALLLPYKKFDDDETFCDIIK
jgi:predicted transcriptional regulator